jgi:hypothetical protein
LILFRSGRVGSDDDGNSDNRANSAQFQVKLPNGAELGKREKKVEEEKKNGKRTKKKKENEENRRTQKKYEKTY